MTFTLDFSRQQSSILGLQTEENIIDWVKSSPLQSRIHVYLRPSRKDPRIRQLKNRLQSLGCVVTACTTLDRGEIPSIA